MEIPKTPETPETRLETPETPETPERPETPETKNVETSAQKTKPKPGESKNNDTDPFDGISDEDIKTYSDLYDEAPPENDDDAVRIAGKIREWIEKDRPNMQKTKKRSMFGLRRK